MPRGDGTGPGTGQGQGRGGDRGRMGGNRRGLGIGGNCRCPSCGIIVSHGRGIPCSHTICPRCGASMIKE